MIPAPPDMYLEFDRRTSNGYLRTEERVYAWDDEGHPLVCGDDGRLVRAVDLPDANLIGRSGNPGPFVAAVPADGWTVTHIYNEQERTDPVVAFAVTADGYAHPVATIGNELNPIEIPAIRKLTRGQPPEV